jgi:hypothetical protein
MRWNAGLELERVSGPGLENNLEWISPSIVRYLAEPM